MGNIGNKVTAQPFSLFQGGEMFDSGRMSLEQIVAKLDTGAVAREAEPVTLVPTEAWETWKRATRDLDYMPDWELVDAVDSLAQEVAR